MGQNINVTIDGKLLKKRIADKELRDSVVSDIKKYNTKNVATLLKKIKTAMKVENSAKIIASKQTKAVKAIKESKAVKELTLEELEAKDTLNKEEKALYKKLLLGKKEEPVAKQAPTYRGRPGEH